MIKGFLHKTKESFFVVLPITLMIFIIIFFIVPTSAEDKLNLFLCFLLLVIGSTFFNTGAETSMIAIGESVGGGLCRTKKFFLILLVAFLIGFITTFAEPDLQIFAQQVAQSFPGMSSSWAIILVVSIGVAIFFALAIIKTIFKLNLPVILTISYVIIFILSFLTNKNFIGLSFDAGSVTTGPISVPFIIAFGLGFASVRWRNKSDDDGFGLIGLCSVGPIISMLIFSFFIKDPTSIVVADSLNIGYVDGFFKYLKEIILVILPIFVIFLIFQFTMLKFPKKLVKKIIFGIICTYLGIVLFLVGVNVGYLPIATSIGLYLASNVPQFWILIIGMVLGFCCVIAEPALQVLKKQITEITHGKLNGLTIVLIISLGVSLSVVMALIKIFCDISILWFLIPIIVGCLVLSFINSHLFTAISFDSGGVATGSLSVSFLLPFMNGIALILGNGTGFGTISLIASMPILTMQILGLIYKIKSSRKEKRPKRIKNETIVDFDWEEVR